jgi:hypothetical protein
MIKILSDSVLIDGVSYNKRLLSIEQGSNYITITNPDVGLTVAGDLTDITDAQDAVYTSLAEAVEDLLNYEEVLPKNPVKSVTVGNDTYLGYAVPGSLTSDPVWAIKKITDTGDFTTTWAEGSPRKKFIFDDYADYTYL